MSHQPLPLTRHKSVNVFVPCGEASKDRAITRNLRTPFATLVPEGDAVPEGAQPGAWTLTLPVQSPFFDTVLAHADTVFSSLPGIQERTRAAKAALAERVARPRTEEVFAFCCTADVQFLPFFFALVDNLLAVHPGKLEIHLLGIGDGIEPLVRAQFPTLPLRVYRLEDVWSETELKHLRKRSIAMQAVSSKSRALLHARRNSDAEAVYLLDLDLYFFRSPAHMNTKFGSAHSLLFPQWSDRFTWARLHGCINTGLIGARKGSEEFLEWWCQACLIRCEFVAEAGLFGDQGFMDQALMYFDGIALYRGCDENVAAWNTQTLHTSWRDGVLCIEGDKPVGSFHAAGPDDDGLFEIKYAWDQIVALFSVLANPDECRPLFLNTVDQQRYHWPALDRALRLRHLVGARLRMKTAPITQTWTNQVTSGWTARLFERLDGLHRRYSAWRGHAPVPDPENDLWVSLQRNALFRPEKTGA